MHFSREYRALESQPWVQIDGVQIKPTNSTRFLGLVVDKRLTWVDHVKARVQTALQFALGSRLIYRQSTSLPLNRLREIFIGKLWSIITYGID